MFNLITMSIRDIVHVMSVRIVAQLNKKVLRIKKRNHVSRNYYNLINKKFFLIYKYVVHLLYTDKKNRFKNFCKFTFFYVYNDETLVVVGDNYA